LQDRAIGVLHYVNEHYSHIPIEPLWLEKLCRWDDARQSYYQQSMKWEESYPLDIPPKHPPWMASELGKLRCLLALGEIEQLEDDAITLKEHTKAADHVEEYTMWMSEVQKLGANAAWMLGRWSSLEDFLEGDLIVEAHDVELNKNASFYRAILAIHKQNYGLAMSLISATRTQLCGAISSLLSESYSRAYRAMVSMQILAELEEVVEYKQTLAKAALDIETMNESASGSDLVITFTSSVSMSNLMNADATTRTSESLGRIDANTAKTALIRKWRGRLKWVPKEVDVYRQILVNMK
jgi:FKBP12-rapamycin complex-associated protein